MSFRGMNPMRVDEKGRLKMPADVKREVDERYGAQFYITSKDGRRADLYPLKEWEEVERKLATLGSTSPARRKFLDMTNRYGQMAEMDAQGRLLLPLEIREAAMLKDDVVLLGTGEYLQVANRAQFMAQLDAEPMSEAESAAIAGLGI